MSPETIIWRDLRRHVFVALAGVLAVSAAWYAYSAGAGHRLVSAIYDGRSWPVLNRLITGQKTLPLGYYQQLADDLVVRVALAGLVLAVVIPLLSALARGLARRELDVVAAISVLGVCFALLLTPPVFSRLFATAFLRPGETQVLWGMAAAVIVLSVCGLRLPRPLRERAATLVIALLILSAPELLFRFVVILSPHTRMKLARANLATYPEFMRYRAHPFLQYTGVPSSAWRGQQMLARDSPYNNFGFKGDDFYYPKPAGTIRVACIGGSTTEAGYPKMLNDFLDRQAAATGRRFEVMNFGISGYSSANSVVNFVLNVRDFTPDYVAIHDGWNDAGIRRPRGPGFRGDYGHSSKPFSPRLAPDRYLVRASTLYRLLREHVAPRPDWTMLEGATNLEEEEKTPTLHEQVELDPFKRNVKTVLDLSLVDGIVPLLVTMPYCTDPRPGADSIPGIRFNNDVLRELARQYAGSAILVDLDASMTGKMNDSFRDVGHVDGRGDQYKATEVGKAILDHLARSGGATVPR